MHTILIIKRTAPFLILGAITLAFYYMGWFELFNLDTLHAHKQRFLEYSRAHVIPARVLFFLIYTGAVALSLPVATLLTLLGGFLFGAFWGTILVVSAATTGATILFLIAKTTLGAALREKAGSLYQKIAENMTENAAGYLLFMRLVPLFPFVLVNIVPALFNVPLRIFIITTGLGILPGSFIYVYVGQALGQIETLDDLVSGQVLLALSLLGCLALVPVLYKRYKALSKKDTSP